MRKAYMMLSALVLTLLGASSVSAADIRADLDPEMFKAWDSPAAGAQVVAEPEPCPNSDGSSSPFGCEYNMYETIGAGSVVYGNTNVYYLWYADITGTKTMNIEGDAGMQLRILMNRPAAEEGGDPHGGQSVEMNVTLNDEGKAEVDLSSMEYIHLNVIKLGWGSPAGIIRKLELVGSVKPVTGWVDMVNNGDMEGDDVSNFVVALDAVKDPGTYPATISDGVGVDGSRGIVVESMDSPAETWQTQFFIKMNEYLPEGTQWRLTMDIKADHDADCGSGCHAEPRDYKSGSIFDPNPHFTTEWQTYEASGTLAQIGDNGLGSIAFDLNVDGSANKYYFDNVHFEVFRESSPISLIKTQYGADVVRIDFGKPTNMTDLVKAAGGERVVYPNDCVTITVNGQPTTMLSIEGRPDGYLWAFIDEGYPEGDGEDLVAVSFTNPEDAAQRVIFTSGKYEGEAVPNFTNLLAEYNFDLSENYSYLYATPMIVKADPENGSFNLPVNMKEFKFTFDHEVDCKALVATLDKEKLNVTPADGYAIDITLTRTSDADLAAGVHTLKLANVKGDKDIGDTGEYSLDLSFGPLNVDPNDQPKEMIPLEYFANCPANSIPEGYIVLFGQETREGGSSQGSGSRMFDFAEGGDFTKGFYFREGHIEYGSVEEHELILEAGKKYNIHFNSAMWKGAGQLTFEILNENDEAVVSEAVTNEPNVNGSTAAVNGSTSTNLTFIPSASGNYRVRWISNGFVEILLANPSMKYVPNTLGAEETALVNAALENAKSVRNGNTDERYNGAAFDALNAVINKYDGVTFTAPSVCRAAAEELDAAAQFMKDHRTLCDTYDPLPEQAQQIIANNSNKKFSLHNLYFKLMQVFDKYGTVETEEVMDPETGETIVNTIVNIKVLKDDAELKTAIDELQGTINLAKAMFTEGAPKLGNWEPTCTGIAVLVDQIRQGAEVLKALGVADDDNVIVAADKALSDDKNLIEVIKNRVKLELYGKLKNADNDLFKGETNPDTGDIIAPTYNMTVFVENPSIYKTKASNTYSEENVPSWTVIDSRGLTNGWADVGTDEIPSDAMFSNWGGNFTVYQTVTDMPAGIYTLMAGFGERMSEGEAANALDGTFFFGMNSENLEDSIGHSTPAVRIGQAFPYANGSLGSLEIHDVVIADGVLTLGVQAGANSHVFFNDVKVFMTAAANTVDYSALYEQILAGIDESVANTAKVRAIELFDLNGRRINSTKQGVYIVRKYMSDGTIRTEKVMKK